MGKSDTGLQISVESRPSQSVPNTILASTRQSQRPHSPQAREPCACHLLHILCNPEVCDEALNTRILGAACSLRLELPVKIKLNELRAKATSGCGTCSIIYDGLYLPHILACWDPQNESRTYTASSATIFLINRTGLFLASSSRVLHFDRLHSALFDFIPNGNPGK